MNTLLGVALLIVQAAMVVSFARGLHRARIAEPAAVGNGVNLVSEMVWISGGAGWLTYGTLTSNLTVALSGALGMTGGILDTLYIWQNKDRRWIATSVAIAVALAMAGSLLVKEEAFAVALSVFGAAQFWPQIYSSAVSIIKRDGHAIPFTGSLLRIAFTGTWLIFSLSGGSGVVDWPVVVWGIVGQVAFWGQFIARVVAVRPEKITVSSTK